MKEKRALSNFAKRIYMGIKVEGSSIVMKIQVTILVLNVVDVKLMIITILIIMNKYNPDDDDDDEFDDR